MFKAKHLSMLCIVILLIIFPCNAQSVTQSVNLTPTEDSYTYLEFNNTNYGNSSDLQTSYNHKQAYIKFYVPNYTNSANLHIYCTGTDGKNTQIYMTSPDWNENEIVWSNPPSVEYTRICQVPMSTADTWYTINVSSVVSEPGYYSFELKSQYGSWNTYNSSEAATDTPYLEIEPSSDTDIIFNNKTNDSSRTFLVNKEDCIRFSITPPDYRNVTSYLWTVNKIVQSSTSSYFDFTVPAYDDRQPSTGIWEIGEITNYTNGTKLYREWLTSSLPESEAPEYIEYFTDLNNTYRPGYSADPWGRYPPFYITTKNYISKGFLTGSSTSSGTTMLTDNNFDITYGTVKLKIRNPGSNDIVCFKVVGDYGMWDYAPDGNGYHDYYAIVNGKASNNKYIPISRRWIGQAPSMHWWKSNQWKEITLIHTRDGWWSAWDNGVLVPGNFQHFEDAFRDATSLELSANSNLEMDCIEVYENKYLYPNSRISYGSYPKWWYVASSGSGLLNPKEEMGIIAFGKDLTLKQISDSVNNKSLMTYDTAKKTAIVKTNLFLEAGSQLNIANETLLFDTSVSSLDINLMIHSTFSVKNSTISTIGNNPIMWNLASSVSMSVFDPVNTKKITDTERCNPKYDFGGRFIVHNSTINNTCNLFLDGPTELVLNNVVFSNHSESNYGDYTLRGAYYGHNNAKYQSIGEKALWIVPRNDIANFMVNNISFVNPKSYLDLKVVGGEWIFNSTTVENCDISNIDISTKKAYKMVYFIHYWNLTEHSDLSLLNCKIDEKRLNVETNKSKLETKYYADIIVKDTSGNPIQNAIITPIASNKEYEAECLYKYDGYVSDAYGPGQGGASDYAPGYYNGNGTLVGNIQNITYSGGSYVRWYNAQPLSSARTNVEGRTSLPSENVNNSIVLTEYVLTNETGNISKELIKYNLTVKAPYSTSFYLKDINPDPTWYRKNPLMSEYTITAIVPENSPGPHIIGFAPCTDNPFNVGENKNFRVWTDGSLKQMNWTVDGMNVDNGTLNYTWNVTKGGHTIKFSGVSTSGTVVSQVWNIRGGSSIQASSGNQTALVELLPENTSLIETTNESVTFSVNSSQLLTKNWFIDGNLYKNNTTDLTKSWNTTGVYNVTFSGSTSNGAVTNTWIVNVVKLSNISIAPEYQVVSPKKSFAINIKVEPGTAIKGTQSDLLFQSSMAKVDKVSEGNLFTQTGANIYFNNGTLNNSVGLIKQINGSILCNSTVSLPGTLAVINLTAGSSTGVAKFNLSNVVISGSSSSVPYAVKNATVLIDTAPVLASIGSKSISETKKLTFTVKASDADANKLVFSASGLPSGASFNQTTGNFTWTPSKGQAGTYNVTFKVSDGYLTDSETVTITVKQVNNSPVISSFEPANNSVFNEGQRIKTSLNASDADNQTLNYTIKIDGAVYSNSSSYVWNTNYSSSGNHTIELSVSDGIASVKKISNISIKNYHPRWDVNKDGIVDFKDINTIAPNYGTTPKAPFPDWDVNQDGVINLDDFLLAESHFGEKVG